MLPQIRYNQEFLSLPCADLMGEDGLPEKERKKDAGHPGAGEQAVLSRLQGRLCPGLYLPVQGPFSQPFLSARAWG